MDAPVAQAPSANTSGLISAGGDIGSSIVAGLFGQHSAKKAMAYQTEMSNTAYQRAANDLQKAGLNRILALGNPATTPPGQQASMPDPRAGSSYQAGASAKTARDVNQNTLRLMEEQITKTHNEAQAAGEQAANVRANTAYLLGQTENLPAVRRQIEQAIIESGARIPTFAASAKASEAAAAASTAQAGKTNTETTILKPKAELAKRAAQALKELPEPKDWSGNDNPVHNLIDDSTRSKIKAWISDLFLGK